MLKPYPAISNGIKFISIDPDEQGRRVKLPPNLKSVPSIMVRDKIYKGEDAFRLVSSLINDYQSQQKQQQQPMHEQVKQQQQGQAQPIYNKTNEANEPEYLDCLADGSCSLEQLNNMGNLLSSGKNLSVYVDNTVTSTTDFSLINEPPKVLNNNVMNSNSKMTNSDFQAYNQQRNQAGQMR